MIAMRFMFVPLIGNDRATPPAQLQRIGARVADDENFPRSDPLAAEEPRDAVHEDPLSGLLVVGEPLDPRVPQKVRRGFVSSLDAYPFPSHGPVPYAEAVFDRAAIEIARGCTEGCRFCQKSFRQ